MREVLYDHNSVLIVAVLLAILLAGLELGFRLGRAFGPTDNEPSKAQINTIQASMLGILALLIGFTFSMALQRFDSRSESVVNEANAIGTAMLRTELLPLSVRSTARDLMHTYVDTRVRASRLSLDQHEERDAILGETVRIQNALWRLAQQAAQEDPNPVVSGLFIQAMNELIDSYGKRDAALNRHVPEIVLFLVFATFVLTACLVGYSSGLTQNRASFATYILVVLIIALVFIIIDLDRPRRGLIEVSQQPLIDLQNGVEPAAGN
ncbi:MAG: hypothetical protein R3288_01500 [Woeseiaceae bacterium]|nr:hypothetical protein [Woeseiaceae bacterium]